MSEFLNASDIGIILRENNLVNNVSSPMKIGEYLCCGLPLILTSGIGDSEGIVKESDCGYFINLESMHIENSILEALVKLDRKKISEIGKKHFSIDSYKERIISYFKTLTK